MLWLQPADVGGLRARHGAPGRLLPAGPSHGKKAWVRRCGGRPQAPPLAPPARRQMGNLHTLLQFLSRASGVVSGRLADVLSPARMVLVRVGWVGMRWGAGGVCPGRGRGGRDGGGRERGGGGGTYGGCICSVRPMQMVAAPPAGVRPATYGLCRRQGSATGSWGLGTHRVSLTGRPTLRSGLV